jgi:hypothetical protein
MLRLQLFYYKIVWEKALTQDTWLDFFTAFFKATTHPYPKFRKQNFDDEILSHLEQKGNRLPRYGSYLHGMETSKLNMTSPQTLRLPSLQEFGILCKDFGDYHTS